MGEEGKTLKGREHRSQSKRSETMARVWLDEKEPLSLCEVVVSPCTDMVNNERAVDRLYRFHFGFLFFAFFLGAACIYLLLFEMTRW